MPCRDPSVERCVQSAEIRAEIAVKIYQVLEKQWAHGCCHIGFCKSCYDGKHANVSDVSRWVEVKKKEMTRAKLRTARTDHR